jgi:glycosyltransferase involved in cell wall biosynthesis
LNSAPTIAVAIPCFNCERELEPCANSILASAARAPAVREIMLIDGGSSDRTSEICARLAYNPLIRVLAHDRTTASAKRNFAFQNTNADYVVFTDPDCIVDADWLPTITAAAAAGIECATGRAEATGEGFETSTRHSDQDRVFHPSLLNRAFAFRAGSSNNLMIRRNLLNEIGGFPEDLGPGTANGVAEDTEVLYRVLRSVRPIHYLSRAIVRHENVPSPEILYAKKSAYARGLSYYPLRRYRSDPATWLSLAGCFAYSFFCLIGFTIALQKVRARQARLELQGRWQGCRLALRN